MPESFGRGALTEAVYYILLTLYNPNHGYGIMQQVLQISGGRVNLGAGTLYGAINTLVDKNWIMAITNTIESRKKEYVITEVGKQVVECEIMRLKELVASGEKVVKR